MTFAISEGFFSRLPLNRIARCITAVLQRLAPGGRFYATWFDNPDPRLFDAIDRGRFTTYPDAEPYHYAFVVLSSASATRSGRARTRVDDHEAEPRPSPRGVGHGHHAETMETMEPMTRPRPPITTDRSGEVAGLRDELHSRHGGA